MKSKPNRLRFQQDKSLSRPIAGLAAQYQLGTTEGSALDYLFPHGPVRDGALALDICSEADQAALAAAIAATVINFTAVFRDANGDLQASVTSSATPNADPGANLPDPIVVHGTTEFQLVAITVDLDGVTLPDAVIRWLPDCIDSRG